MWPPLVQEDRFVPDPSCRAKSFATARNQVVRQSRRTSPAIKIMLTAKPTIYNQQKFASRLEARWGYFLTGMSIPFQYEKEAYDLDGLTYVPDFFLEWAWLEVKGEIITDQIGLTVIRKCTRLAQLSNLPVILAFDDPLNQKCAVFGKKGGFYPHAHFSVCRICAGFGIQVRHLEETRFVCANRGACVPVDPSLIRVARRHAFDTAMEAKKHKFGISRKAA